MGFRFRRSVTLIPGVRLGVSRSGPSISVGVRGARLSLSSRGIRTTVGVPGSGLSYVTQTNFSNQERSRPTSKSASEMTRENYPTFSLSPDKPKHTHISYFIALIILGAGVKLFYAAEVSSVSTIPSPFSISNGLNSSNPTSVAAGQTVTHPALVDPTVAQPLQPQTSLSFDDGHRDRIEYETWFNAITPGNFRDGAFWWAQHRSAKFAKCAPSLSHLTNNFAAADWTAGCREGQKRLTPSDIRRNSDPSYRQGWNSG